MYYTKGKHAFKFGTLFNRYNQYMDSTNGARGNSLTFVDMAHFLEGAYSTGSYTSRRTLGPRTLSSTPSGSTGRTIGAPRPV